VPTAEQFCSKRIEINVVVESLDRDQVGVDVIAFQAGQAGTQFTGGGAAEHLGRIQNMALWWGGWKVHRSYSQRRRRWQHQAEDQQQ